MGVQFKKAGLTIIVNISFLITAFYLISQHLKWSDIAHLILRADLKWTILAIGLTFFVFIPMAYRWSYLLFKININYAFLKSYRACLAGLFAGLFIPGSLGGDAARIAFCKRDTKSSVVVISGALFIEKVIGLVSLILLIMVGLKFTDIQSQITFFKYLPHAFVLSILFLIFFLLALQYFFAGDRKQVVSPFIPHKIIHKLKCILAPFQQIRIKTCFMVMLISIVVHLADVMTAYTLSQALGIKVSLYMILIALPASYLVMVIPFSIGGLGIREGTFAFIFSIFGISVTDSVALGLSIFLTRSFVALFGGLLALDDLLSFRRLKKPDKFYVHDH